MSAFGILGLEQDGLRGIVAVKVGQNLQSLDSISLLEFRYACFQGDTNIRLGWLRCPCY